MKRFDCLKSLAPLLDPKTIVVTNVGPICREWNALRPSDANLLQVNLGLCAAVGLGIAVALPHRQVVMLDGDGNLLLNLASLADLANQNLNNIIHIVLDNESYEGGGGLKSATAGKADLAAIAHGAGIVNATVVTTVDEFRSWRAEPLTIRDIILSWPKWSKAAWTTCRPSHSTARRASIACSLYQSSEGVDPAAAVHAYLISTSVRGSNGARRDHGHNHRGDFNEPAVYACGAGPVRVGVPVRRRAIFPLIVAAKKFLCQDALQPESS
jgi:hypothetical protein